MNFHVMLKPVGARCNLNCSYCFFHSKRKTLKSNSTITPDLLETFIQQYIDAHDPGVVVFTWQGGEPTLAGLDFFNRAVLLQKKHITPGKTIANDLQTNGQLLDDRWCSFLKEHNFLVGLSLDGPEQLHDAYRHTNGGGSSFRQAMLSAKLLKKYQIPFNTLTALHRINAKHPDELYHFLRDEVGSTFMQFLPVVEPVNHANMPPGFWPLEHLPVVGSLAAGPGHHSSFVAEWCIEPEDYGHFLTRVFDLWRQKDIGNIVLPVFESLLALWLGMKSGMCVFDDHCGHALALDSDGSMYFCDRFCYPEYHLGNLNTNKLKYLISSQQLHTWGKLKASVSPKCKQCKWAFACKGECPKNRFLKDESGNIGLNYLCPGLQIMFEHLDPHLQSMAASLRENALSKSALSAQVIQEVL